MEKDIRNLFSIRLIIKRELKGIKHPTLEE